MRGRYLVLVTGSVEIVRGGNQVENTGRSCKGLDLKRNYYALYLSIVQKKSVSESLGELNIVSGHGKSKRRRKIRKIIKKDREGGWQF